MPGIHRKERENRKRKTHLTHTGLLMEGVALTIMANCHACKGSVFFGEGLLCLDWGESANAIAILDCSERRMGDEV
jgi:hypothetical protein